MDENKTASQKPIKPKSGNKNKNNKPQVDIVPWQNQEICVVEGVDQCRNLATKLRSHCTDYNVLGIGCDWTKYKDKKMVLLMLSTSDGLCALIRLSVLKRVPAELQKILEDDNILKVTVDPVDVAMKLAAYGVFVASVFDLRYLAIKCNAKPLPLAKLSVDHLKVKLVENYRLEELRLRSKRLKESDIKYAAKSVRVPIELFKLFEEKLKDPSSNVRKFIDAHCKEYLNKPFRFENLDKSETPATTNGAENKRLLSKPSIYVVASAEKCKKALSQIRQHCNKYKVLGFGCKLSASRSTVTLLQLATNHGFCALIQLSKLKTIPDELKELLEDESIIKVGGRVFADADRLQRDYDVCVANTIDLRHLAKECSYQTAHFDRLSKDLLNVDLSVDDWRLLVADWKADKVPDDALNYATKTVQVLIELFKVFEEKLVKDKYSGDRTKFIEGICQEYSNEDFPKIKPENIVQEEDVELSEQNIQVVNTAEECKAVVQQLLADCDEYNVLGFDCEWIPVGQRKVAMLQLASNRGLCALIRLCKMKKIPNELRELLKDKSILKVGISPNQDASRLAKDYRLEVNGTLDLTRLAKKCQYKSEGLANLAREVLNVKLPLKKDGLIVRKLHSEWEKDTLNGENIKYAANDVHVSIELFKMFEKKLSAKNPSNAKNDNQTTKLQHFIHIQCTPHVK